jgi:PBSX family phage terminase large subunit
MAFAVAERPPTPAERPYAPHGTHRAYWPNRDLIVLVDGPAGTGKTISILNRLIAQTEKYPGMRALLVRKTRTSLSETILATFEDKVLPEGHYLLDGADRMQRAHYEWANGSRWILGGLDKPTKLFSGEFDIVYLAEAIEATQDEATSLLRALRSGVMPYQQLIMDTNPGPHTHWLKRWADDGKLTRFRSTHSDNPYLTPAYLAGLQRMEGALYQRMYLGNWVSAEGTVYELKDAHLGDDLFQPNKPTQLAVDPSNGSGPYAALVLQQVGTRVLVVGEFYLVGGMDEDLRDWLLASPYLARLTKVVCDPAKQDTIKRLRSMLKVHVQAKEGRKDINAQINAVKSLMIVDPQTKQAPLCIDRGNCPMLLDEFSQYVHQQPSAAHPDRNAPETPVDAHNHCLDALAYWVTTRALLGSKEAEKREQPKPAVPWYAQPSGVRR